MTNALRIYGFPLSGHSHRVQLFASLAGIAHEIINVDLAKGEQKSAEFLALNPAGQVPVIVDGENVISDSNAILVYLARKYAPSFLPDDLLAEAQIQRFLTLAAGEIAFGPAAARLINVFKASLDPKFAKQTAQKVLSKLDTHLIDKEYLVGNSPTIADVSVYSYLAHAPEGGISLQDFPNVRRLLNNIESLDGFIPMPSTKVGLVK
jgi:glutathione S-transferase